MDVLHVWDWWNILYTYNFSKQPCINFYQFFLSLLLNSRSLNDSVLFVFLPQLPLVSQADKRNIFSYPFSCMIEISEKMWATVDTHIMFCSFCIVLIFHNVKIKYSDVACHFLSLLSHSLHGCWSSNCNRKGEFDCIIFSSCYLLCHLNSNSCNMQLSCCEGIFWNRLFQWENWFGLGIGE